MIKPLHQSMCSLVDTDIALHSMPMSCLGQQVSEDMGDSEIEGLHLVRSTVREFDGAEVALGTGDVL